MKDYKERKNFILRIIFWKCLVPIPKLRLKSAPQKLNFAMAIAISQSHALGCSCKCTSTSRIATHNKAALLLIKTTLCETNSIFLARTVDAK